MKNIHKINQNIYITNDEEIKDVRPYKGKWQLEKEQILNKFPNYLTDLSDCKLVIMTTDQDLIKDGVQAIDDDFLEWFVKNPSCEEVKIEKFHGMNTSIAEVNFISGDGLLNWEGRSDLRDYKIIIPKEESKQELLQFGTKEFNTFFSDLCDKNLGGNTKNKIKQTAVEWLENELNQLLVLFSTKWEQVNKAIEQAKEMEKKQLKEMYLKGIENYDPTLKNK
jgi:hypothetical protein